MIYINQSFLTLVKYYSPFWCWIVKGQHHLTRYAEEYERAEKAEKEVAELKRLRNYQYDRAEEEYERAEKAEKKVAYLKGQAERFRGYERLTLQLKQQLEQDVKEIKQISSLFLSFDR